MPGFNESINKTLNIPEDFIVKHMPKAPAVFSVVYIYAYGKKLLAENLSLSEISKDLGLTRDEVKSAFLFWDEKGILSYDDKTDTVDFFASIKTRKQSFLSRRVEYLPEEIAVYTKKSPTIKKLFESSAEILGNPLSNNDMKVIFEFYDWLGFNVEMIKLLLTYCADNGHRNMRYIERVAISWAEDGITTADDIKSRIALYNNDFRRIMRSMGQSGRNPSKKEEDYMKKWLKIYNLPLNIIEAGCERAILRTGKTSFAYADSILTSWFNAKVKTLADIERLEAEFSKNKPPKPEIKKNAFTNYSQRTYDFDEYEKQERERRKKYLEG